MNQTSGIPDYDQSPDWWQNLGKNVTKEWHASTLIDLAYAQQDKFPPGSAWAYSNTNYVLLGMVLEKVTGRKLAVLMQALFKEAKLDHTYFQNHPYSPGILPQMAHGYFANNSDMTELNGSWLQAAGAIISTPSDMVKWLRFLLAYCYKLKPAAQFSFPKIG